MSAPFLLKIRQVSASPIGFVTSAMSTAYRGKPYRYRFTLIITPQPTSDPTKQFQYNARDIKVGHWFTTHTTGAAFQITSIESNTSATNIVVIGEDINLYNIASDPTKTGTAVGPNGDGICFDVAAVGLPLVGPLANGVMAPQVQANLQTRFIFEGRMKATGYMEEPPVGKLWQGAIPTWVEDVTKQTDAIVDLNRFVTKIAPKQPHYFSNYIFSFQNGSPWVNDYIDHTSETPYGDFGIKLANGVTSNEPKIVPAGTYVQAIKDFSFTTYISEPLWVGNAGTITYRVDNVVQTTLVLDSTDKTGTYTGGLTIASNGLKDGLWPEVSLSLGGAINANYATFEIEHSITGKKLIPFVLETEKTPVVTDYSLDILYEGDIKYLSGIPHIGTADNYTYDVYAKLSNIVGNAYPVKIAKLSGGILKDEYIAAGTFGSPEIFNKDHPEFTLAGALTPMEYNENVPAYSGPISLSAHSVFTTRTVPLKNVNMYFGPAQTIISESNEGLDPIVAPKRHLLASGATPVVGPINYASEYDSETETPAYEASVVGGVLKFDQTNYSEYYPVGPDYSDKDDTQYACFKLQGITNNLRLTVMGRFTEMYIKLPGINFDTPNATNGWFNATKQADFPPGSWPGSQLATDGCLRYIDVGSVYNLSFGSLSSSFSTENIILIRFVLKDGDAVTALYNNVSI